MRSDGCRLSYSEPALLLSFIPTADEDEYCIGEELSMNSWVVPYVYCLRKPPRPGFAFPGYLYLSQSVIPAVLPSCFPLSCVSVIYKSRNERPLIFGTTVRKLKRFTYMIQMRKAYFIKNTCIRPILVETSIRVCFPITRIHPKPPVHCLTFSVDMCSCLSGEVDFFAGRPSIQRCMAVTSWKCRRRVKGPRGRCTHS